LGPAALADVWLPFFPYITASVTAFIDNAFLNKSDQQLKWIFPVRRLGFCSEAQQKDYVRLTVGE